jgi:hypothetical protein
MQRNEGLETGNIHRAVFSQENAPEVRMSILEKIIVLRGEGCGAGTK